MGIILLPHDTPTTSKDNTHTRYNPHPSPPATPTTTQNSEIYDIQTQTDPSLNIAHQNETNPNNINPHIQNNTTNNQENPNIEAVNTTLNTIVKIST